MSILILESLLLGLIFSNCVTSIVARYKTCEHSGMTIIVCVM
jgi:hypothetical protein